MAAHHQNNPRIEFNAGHASINATGDVGSHNTVYHCSYHGDTTTKESIVRFLRGHSVSYRPTHDSIYLERTLETGNAFFESIVYNTWASAQSNSEHLNLECLGSPGVGKTSTVSAIIEDLLHRSSPHPKAVFYAYFRHDTKSFQTAPKVLTNLLCQALEAGSEPSQTTLSLWRDYFADGTLPRLDRIVAALKSEISKYKAVHIVIDALDEYSPSDCNASTSLVRYLEALGTRLLITSRFSVPFTQDAYRLRISAADEDIGNFIRCNWTRRLINFTKDCPGLEEEIMGKIIRKSKGMFILARLLVESISELLTIADIRATLENLPEGLIETYHLAMTRIDSQGPGLRKLARRVLSWVRFADRVLTVLELRHAVALEMGMNSISEENLPQEEDILIACAGLLAFEKGVDRHGRDIRHAQFVHFSTQEFFERFSDQYFPDAEQDITETCLRYLIIMASTLHDKFPDFPNPYSWDEWRMHRVPALQEYPLCGWASSEWGLHASTINEEFDRRLVDDLFLYPVAPYLSPPGTFSFVTTAAMPPSLFRVLYSARYNLMSLWDQGADALRRLSVDTDAYDANRRTALHISAIHGNHRVVARLLDLEHRALDSLDACGLTALSYAAVAGHADLVDKLLCAGADPNASNEEGRVPLFYASSEGHLGIVSGLLRANADPNVRAVRGLTPLASAAHAGYSEIVIELLRANADPGIPDKDGLTPLTYAVKEGHSDIVDMFLRANTPPDVQDVEGRTSLSHASECHLDIMAALLSAAADPNIPDLHGRTPLSIAVKMGCACIVSELLNAKANPNTADLSGKSPLAYAVEWDYGSIVDLLLDANADPNEPDADGRTPLSSAIEEGYSDTVTKLLGANAYPDTLDSAGRTPLSHAAEQGQVDVVAQLLRAKADPNIVDIYGWTPLSIAAKMGHLSIVSELLGSNANPDTLDVLGRTSLSYASEEGHLDIVTQLLSAGADPTTMDDEGHTALSYAVDRDHCDVMVALMISVDGLSVTKSNGMP